MEIFGLACIYALAVFSEVFMCVCVWKGGVAGLWFLFHFPVVTDVKVARIIYLQELLRG